MREILFRGKRIDSGEWEYGGCVFTENKVCLIYNQTHSIDLQGCTVEENSVGQYTGLTDKNGRKIFEGDIIHLKYSQVFFGGEYFGEYTAEVSYKEGCFITDGPNNGDEIETPLSGFDNDELEIIGNIHDNPELLKEVKNYAKKQKCKACGFKFRLEKENRYLARKGSSAVNALTERPAIIEMFDCPQCGCQNAVGIYEKPIEGEVK